MSIQKALERGWTFQSSDILQSPRRFDLAGIRDELVTLQEHILPAPENDKERQKRRNTLAHELSHAAADPNLGEKGGLYFYCIKPGQRCIYYKERTDYDRLPPLTVIEIASAPSMLARIDPRFAEVRQSAGDTEIIIEKLMSLPDGNLRRAWEVVDRNVEDRLRHALTIVDFVFDL